MGVGERKENNISQELLRRERESEMNGLKIGLSCAKQQLLVSKMEGNKARKKMTTKWQK